MIEKLYTVEEVAELASVTGRTIRNYLKSGRLVGRKIGGQWRFPESEVQRLLQGPSAANPPQHTESDAEPATEATSHQDAGFEPPADSAPEPAATSGAADNVPPDTSFYGDHPQPAPVPRAVQPPDTDFGRPSLTVAAPQPAEPSRPGPAASLPSQEVKEHQPDAGLVSSPRPAAVTEPSPAPNYSVSGEPKISAESANPSPSIRPEHVVPPPYPAATPETVSAPAAAAQPTSAPVPQQPAVPQPAVPQPVQPPAQTQPPAPSYPAATTAPATAEPAPPLPPADYAAQPPTAAPTGYVAPPAPMQPAYPQQAQQSVAPASQPAPPPAYYGPQPAAPAPAQPAYPAAQAAVPPYLQQPAASSQPIAKRQPIEDIPSPAQPLADPFPDFSEAGKRVTRFITEVHDCAMGPQVCAIVDLNQPLAVAKATSVRLNDIARQESRDGVLCECLVEYDERYMIARYTIFGHAEYLRRCLSVLG